MKNCTSIKNIKIKAAKAQSLVEAALILPFILLMLCGIIDCGLMLGDYLIISNASREAARIAAIGSGNSYITGVINDITESLDSSRININIAPDEQSRKKGDMISVIITYQYDVITPILSSILSGNVILTAKTVMRME